MVFIDFDGFSWIWGHNALQPGKTWEHPKGQAVAPIETFPRIHAFHGFSWIWLVGWLAGLAGPGWLGWLVGWFAGWAGWAGPTGWLAGLDAAGWMLGGCRLLDLGLHAFH